jgi:glucokinase
MALANLVGIEIGGTKLQLGLGDGLGNLEVLERRRIDPARGAAGILTQIVEVFESLLLRSGLSPPEIRAAGVGFGGPIDLERDRIERSFQVEGWDDFPLSDWVRDHLRVPLVALGNDADVAGLAEARFGAGIGRSPLVYITVGSGIGGALIVDNQIYAGCGRGAMEIGHLHVPVGGTTPPRLRELEQVASGWGIGAAARDAVQTRLDSGETAGILLDLAGGEVELITADLVARGASQGDEISAMVLDQARTALAFALTQMIALVAPRRIVIGGGVSLIGEEFWFEPIRQRVDRDIFPPFRGQCDIVAAALGEDVVVHGALALASDALAGSRGIESRNA